MPHIRLHYDLCAYILSVHTCCSDFLSQLRTCFYSFYSLFFFINPWRQHWWTVLINLSLCTQPLTSHLWLIFILSLCLARISVLETYSTVQHISILMIFFIHFFLSPSVILPILFDFTFDKYSSFPEKKLLHFYNGFID